MAHQPTSRQVLSFEIEGGGDLPNYRGSTILVIESIEGA
jgi:hypothetical protein